MKKLLTLVLAIFLGLPVLASASGTLTMSGNYYKSDKDFKPTVGLGIYEKLADGVAYNSWTGLGGEHNKSGIQWASSKHMIEFYVKRFTLGAGVQLEWDRESSKVTDSLAVKVGYKLW